MPGDRLDELGRLLDEGRALAGQAEAARARASGARGSDKTGMVTVSVDGDGRVVALTVAAGWRRHLGPEGIGVAVRDAVRAATVARLAEWGAAYADPGPPGVAPGEHRDDLAERLRELATARMSGADTRVALTELLAMARDLERGIDEASERLRSAVGATHSGRSPDRHVTVTITGAGEVAGVHYDRHWLRGTHEINIGRQTVAAFRAAYREAAAHGADRIVAGSGLGEVQRATQDPFGLARRLRLRD